LEDPDMPRSVGNHQWSFFLDTVLLPTVYSIYPQKNLYHFILKGVIMGLFSKILDKLGLNRPAKVAPVPQAPPPPRTVPAAPPAPAAIAVVDVVAQLEKLAASNPQKLNWKVSIVDLLKLLGLDSSFAARKELAVELGCPSEKMGDSAQMNMWLHKTVLQKIADNGGNIPKDLLD
jgi:hypothetical protein